MFEIIMGRLPDENSKKTLEVSFILFQNLFS